MIYISILFSFLFLTPLFPDSAWETSLEKALAQSKEQKKHIFVDVYTDWCGYCKQLESKVFPQENVAKELSGYVNLRINGDVFPDFIAKYKVTGYPTLLILDSEGSLIDRIVGLPSGEFLAKKLKDNLTAQSPEKIYLTALKDDPDNIQANYSLGKLYYGYGKFDEARLYLLKSYQSKAEDKENKKHESLFLIGIIKIQETKFSESVTVWSEYIEKFPAVDLTTAYYCRGVSQLLIGNKKEAKEDLEKAKSICKDAAQLEKINFFLSKIEI